MCIRVYFTAYVCVCVCARSKQGGNRQSLSYFNTTHRHTTRFNTHLLCPVIECACVCCCTFVSASVRNRTAVDDRRHTASTCTEGTTAQHCNTKHSNILQPNTLQHTPVVSTGQQSTIRRNTTNDVCVRACVRACVCVCV